MSTTELRILLALAACGLTALIVVAASCILRARDGIRSYLVRRRMVAVEEVQLFAKRGCILCHGAGTVAKRPHPHAPAIKVPCGCASRGFLKRHGKDLEQRGQLILWKRRQAHGNRHARLAARLIAAGSA